MKRPLVSARSLVPLAALTLAGTVGCLDNNDSLTIVENVLVDRIHTMCTVPSAPGLFLSEGTLDVSLVEAGFSGYVLYPLVRNNIQLSSTASSNVTMGGMNNVTVNGFDVELHGPLVDGLPTSVRQFHYPLFGSNIMPQGLASEGFEGLPRDVVTMVSANVTPDLPEAQRRIIVRHRATGVRAGETMKSGWVDFPVTLCRGCLSGFTAGAPDCPAGGIKMNQIQQGSCTISQDEGVTCCVDTNSSNLLCGPLVPISM